MPTTQISKMLAASQMSLLSLPVIDKHTHTLKLNVIQSEKWIVTTHNNITDTLSEKEERYKSGYLTTFLTNITSY